MNEKGTRVHMPGLDGLRGIAIGLVLLFHFGELFWVPVTPLADAMRMVVHACWVGVDIFFVLSGFLITDILLRSRGAPRYFRTFWGRRALRIFPLYYAILAVVLFALPIQYTAGLHERQGYLWAYASNLWPLLHDGWGFATPFVDLNHTWSLAIEEQFYLFWPLVIAFCSERKALTFALSGVALSLLLRIAMVQQGLEGAAYIKVYCNTLTRLDGLLLGSALAIVRRVPSLGPTVTERTKRWLLPALLVPAALVFAWRGPYYQEPVQATLGFTLLAVASAALITMGLSPARHPWLARVLGFAPLVWLGRYSYGIYLIHGVLRQWVRYRLIEALSYLGPAYHKPEWSIVFGILIGSSVSCAAAFLIYHVLEAPMLRLKDRLFPSRATADKHTQAPNVHVSEAA